MTPAPQTNTALWATIALGLVFAFLAQASGDSPRSPFLLVQWALFGLMLVGMLRPRVLPIPARFGLLAFVGLSWLFGMAYETSLTVDGTGIGGVHPQTFASFVLAQGDYLPIAFAAYAALRWLGADFRALFWLAAGKSLTEGLIFTGVLAQVVTGGQIWAAPFVLAYYALAYATFVAMPALFLPRTKLTDKTPPDWPAMVWVAIGFGTAFMIRAFWGALYAPLVTLIFGLPENL